jgi:hypothetical protein
LGHAFERFFNLDVRDLSPCVLFAVPIFHLVRLNALNFADKDGIGASVGLTHGGIATTTASIDRGCVKKQETKDNG